MTNTRYIAERVANKRLLGGVLGGMGIGSAGTVAANRMLKKKDGVEKKAFWEGFEKKASQVRKASHYDFAIHHHIETFNADAMLKRDKTRAYRVHENGTDYVVMHDPGKKGFFGLGKKVPSAAILKVRDNTKGQINKAKDAPAIYFEDMQKKAASLSNVSKSFVKPKSLPPVKGLSTGGKAVSFRSPELSKSVATNPTVVGPKGGIKTV